MNKTLSLILMVLLVGGAGAYFAMTGDDGLEVSQIETEVLVEDDGEAPDSLDADALQSEGVETEKFDDTLPEGLEDFMREEVAGGEGEGNARALVLQVWDGKKGVPAVETDVFILDGFDGDRLKDPFAQHWSGVAENQGQRFKTDVKGRVELPPVQKRAIVTAQGPGTYGFAMVGRRHREVETITLHVDETVTVRVVAADKDGEDRTVAGVPVGLVQRIPAREYPRQMQALMVQMDQLAKQEAKINQFIRENPGRRGEAAPRIEKIRNRQREIKGAMRGLKGGGNRGRNGGRKGGDGKKKGRGKKKRPAGAAKAKQKPEVVISLRSEVKARRLTDGKGIAVFRHFQAYRQQHEKWWPGQHVSQFQAVLLMPLSQPESREFSGQPVKSKTIELRLPPTGSISLRMVDLDGRPFTHPVHADLRMNGGVDPWERIKKRKDQNETEIVFSFVGLGLEFTAQCRLDDEDFRWNVPLFAGPDKPGERVTIDVVVAPKEGMLFGRLLDAADKPLAGLRPSFLINTSTGRLEGEDVTTDIEGRFHLPYQAFEKNRPPFRLEIRQNNVRPAAGFAMPLQGLPAGRVTDLGDLRLDAFAAIARGLVIDDRGQPVPGANVQLVRERDLNGDPPRRAFVDEAFVMARADKEGRYELFGELESARYRVRVSTRRHFPFESDDIQPGAELDLKLLRNSKVVGTVLSPSWLPSRDLKVVLVSAVNTKQRREDRIHDHRGKKYVYFDWVKPGVYNILISLRSFPDPIMRIDGIQIEPGQQGLHRRLLDLDIGALLRRFQLTAVNERGQPIKPDWPLIAQVVRPNGQTSFVGFKWMGQKLEIISASTQLEVWPMADGYSADRTFLSPGPNEVRFLKIPPVELVLPGMRRLVGQAMVWIKLQSVGPVVAGSPQRLATWDGPSNRIGRWFRGRLARKTGVLLGPGESVKIPSVADGQYKVIAFLLATGKNRITRAVPVDFGAVNVHIVPGGGLHRVTVSVDVEKVQKGLAELVRREAASAKRP